MTAADRGRFAACLTALAETFAEPCSVARLEGYFAALEDLPLPAVEAAIQGALRTATFFPRPAELRALAGVGDPDVGVVDSLVHDLLWGRPVPTPAFAQLALERIGGRRAVEDMPAGVRFAHLRDALPGLLAAARAQQLPLPGLDYVPQVVRRALEAPDAAQDTRRVTGPAAALVASIGQRIA